MSEVAMPAGGDRIVAEVAALAEEGGTRIGRFLYPMRILGTLALVAIVVLAAEQSGGLHTFHWLLIALFLVYPHLSKFLAGRLGRPRAVELASSLVDDFALGAAVYTAGFSPVPTSSLLTVALANGMALGGPRMLALAGLVTAFGATVAMPFLGVNFLPREHLEVDLTAAGFLLVYFNLFAYTAWARSLALIQSRRNMRQEKLAAEIETKKTESLLLAILPPAAARELTRRGEVEPRAFDDAALLVVDLERAVNGVEPDAQAVVGELNHCFKAFDAIGERHGLEPLKTAGTRWIAASGLGAEPARVGETATAALEIRDFMASHAETRRGAGLAEAPPRIALHAGPLLGGVVETRKFSFDVWGPAAEQALALVTAAPPGEVWISSETATRLGTRFRYQAVDGGVVARDGSVLEPLRLLGAAD